MLTDRPILMQYCIINVTFFGYEETSFFVHSSVSKPRMIGILPQDNGINRGFIGKPFMDQSYEVCR